MTKDKFIEFCVEYLPYKECVGRYVGDELAIARGLVVVCCILMVAYVLLVVKR